MNLKGMEIVSIVTFLPLVGALLLALLPNTQTKLIKTVGIGVAVVTFLASLALFTQFKSTTYHFQLQEYVPWIKSLGISYWVGVDGISIWLVMLTTFLQI